MTQANSSKELPKPWLVALNTPGTVPWIRHTFPDGGQLEEYFDAHDLRPEDWIVFRDGPKVRVRVDGRCIASPQDVAVRNNWLARNKAYMRVASLRTSGAIVYTWEDGEPEDPLSPRFGGRAPLPLGARWPKCSSCGRVMMFVGTLDFRASPMRANVPGDALGLHYCFECLGEIHAARVYWLDRADVRLREIPSGAPHGGPYEGTPWTTQDNLWNPECFEHEEIIRKFKLDAELIGHHSFLFVTVYGTKVGGQIFWIQADETPVCQCGKAMRFVGQFLGFGGIEFGDSGLAYIFHCSGNKCSDTKVVVQFF